MIKALPTLESIYLEEDWNAATPSNSLLSGLVCGDSLRSAEIFKDRLEFYLSKEAQN